MLILKFSFLFFIDHSINIYICIMNSTQLLLLGLLVWFAMSNKSKDTRNVLLVVAGILFFCMMNVKEGFTLAAGVEGTVTGDVTSDVFTIVSASEVSSLNPPTMDIGNGGVLCRVLPHRGKMIARSSASHAGWPRVALPRWRDAALAPRPPPMVGDIPPCPRVVSRATLPGPVAASRLL